MDVIGIKLAEHTMELVGHFNNRNWEHCFNEAVRIFLTVYCGGKRILKTLTEERPFY